MREREPQYFLYSLNWSQSRQEIKILFVCRLGNKYIDYSPPKKKTQVCNFFYKKSFSEKAGNWAFVSARNANPTPAKKKLEEQKPVFGEERGCEKTNRRSLLGQKSFSSPSFSIIFSGKSAFFFRPPEFAPLPEVKNGFFFLRAKSNLPQNIRRKKGEMIFSGNVQREKLRREKGKGERRSSKGEKEWKCHPYGDMAGRESFMMYPLLHFFKPPYWVDIFHIYTQNIVCFHTNRRNFHIDFNEAVLSERKEKPISWHTTPFNYLLARGMSYI